MGPDPKIFGSLGLGLGLNLIYIFGFLGLGLGLGLVGNSILGKYPKKKCRNLISYLYNPVLPEVLIFRKKTFFHFFKKLRDFKTFFNQILFDHML